MQWRANFFLNEEGCKMPWVKAFFVADLLRRQYLFKILQTSLTVKSKGKSGKNLMLRKTLNIERAKYFWNWVRISSLYVEILIFRYITRKSKTWVTSYKFKSKSSNSQVTSSNPRDRTLKERVTRLSAQVGRLKARVRR